MISTVHSTPPRAIVILDFDDTLTRGSTTAAYYRSNFTFDGQPLQEGVVIHSIQKPLTDRGMLRGDALQEAILQVNNMFRKGPDQRGRYIGEGTPCLPFSRLACLGMPCDVDYAPGAKDFIQRIKQYGEQNGVQVYACILSSNARTFLELTSPGQQADGIYSSDYAFNDRGEVIGFIGDWMSPERKAEITQELQRKHPSPNSESSSFAHFVGMDDGDTGREFLELIKKGGGIAMGISTPGADQPHLADMFQRGQINVQAVNDFRPGSSIWEICTKHVDGIASLSKRMCNPPPPRLVKTNGGSSTPTCTTRYLPSNGRRPSHSCRARRG